MADRTGIEWTDATWNPVRGCARVSEGCRNCYAERVAARFAGAGQPYEGLIHHRTHGWNGKVRILPNALRIPWAWSRSRRIFVNSMSDLFHDDVPFEFIAAVFWVMAHTNRHQYQVLTKRPERMLAFFDWLLDQHDEYLGDKPGSSALFFPPGHEQRALAMANGLDHAAEKVPELKALGWEPWREGGRRGGYDNCGPGWPYSNVWLGVSVEDQATADHRIPLLLKAPAAVRWISAEPLLGPLNFRWSPYPHEAAGETYREYLERNGRYGEFEALHKLDWVVVGGESGPGARPMHPDWARSLRDQCVRAGVPFLFKQWGEWAPHEAKPGGDMGGDMRRGDVKFLQGDGREPDGHFRRGDAAVERVGKRNAGRLLDGVTWDAYPRAL